MKPQYFLLALAGVILFFLIELFQPFLKAMIVAILITFATNTFHSFLVIKTKNTLVSTIISTLLIALIFFLPLIYFTLTIAKYLNEINKDKIMDMIEASKEWISNIPDDFIFIKEQLFLVIEKIDIPNLLQNILSIGAYLGRNSATFMIDMIMILIFYFFFNHYSRNISNFLKDILPIAHEESDTLFRESSSMMSIVLYSIIVTAVFEGVLFGVFVSFYGYDGLLLGILYGFATLVPVVGGLILWLPVALHELYLDNITNAIVISVYSIVVISIIADTFIKPIIIKYINKKVVKTPTSVNEMLIFFAILAGLSTFGFWGMIIGPALVSFFISILHILKKYSNNVI